MRTENASSRVARAGGGRRAGRTGQSGRAGRTGQSGRAVCAARPSCARGQGQGRVGNRLVASFVALLLALGLFAGVGVAGALTGSSAPQSTAGSSIGILVDNTPSQDDIDSGKFQGNDSYLGILMTPAPSESVTATFMLTQGSVYVTVELAKGSLLVPPNDPVWTGAIPDGFAGTPVFDRWCVDEEATTAYDFGTPVNESITLWAGWAEGEPVDVTLDAGAGGVVPDPDAPDATPERTLVVKRYPGAVYRELPVPERAGYTFVCWQTVAGDAIDPATDVVPEGGITLHARWQPNTYWIHYAFNNGTGGAHDVLATYDDATLTFLSWDELSAVGASKPYGKDFDGWNTQPDGTGTSYAPGSSVPNLTAVAGGSVSLYAQWKDSGTVEDGPFDVTFYFNDGTGSTHVVEDVEKFGTVPEEDPVKAPKRTGYQFAGWFTDDGTFAHQWKFGDQVTSDLALWAKWELRLDVTVPVSVGFAVDASTREALGPDAEAYAIKSRTVVPVEVSALELTSDQGELAAFFETAEGAVWEEGVAASSLSLKSERAAGAVQLALAGERREIAAAERGAWALAAFSYAGVAEDDGWQGADPSERLRIAYALAISDKLGVKVGHDAALPIAHVKVTVMTSG